jgi:hypothetical protein
MHYKQKIICECGAKTKSQHAFLPKLMSVILICLDSYIDNYQFQDYKNWIGFLFFHSVSKKENEEV